MTAYAINLTLLAGIIAGRWFGLEEAENLAGAFILLLCAATWLVIAYDAIWRSPTASCKPMLAGDWAVRYIRYLQLAIAITLFAAGWSLLATIYTLTWFAILVRREHEKLARGAPSDR